MSGARGRRACSRGGGGVAVVVLAALVPLGGAEPSRVEVTALPGVGSLARLGIEAFAAAVNGGAAPGDGAGELVFHVVCAASNTTRWREGADPVVMWYNGGPGASSLFGMLQEFGPLLLTERSFDAKYKATGVPTPQSNPWAWSRDALVCAVDSPPPFGFSYCTAAGPTGGPTSCGPWTDSAVFKANRAAYAPLFQEAFPEIIENGAPVFVAGESYAGVYVPGIVNELLEDPIPGLKLAGFAVGDGLHGCMPRAERPANWCIDLDNVGVFKYPNALPGPRYDVDFFHGHSSFSERLYRSIMITCSDSELDGDVPLGKACGTLIDEMSVQVGPWWPYNIYNACPADTFPDKHGASSALRVRSASRPPVTPGDGDGGVGSPCRGAAMSEWLSHNATKEALGLPLDARFLNVDNGHGFSYTTDQPFVGPIYERALKEGLRVLVYEGDVDACGLQTAPNEDTFVKLFDDLGLKQTQPWRPWALGEADKLLGGYSIVWEDGRAMLASIKGAGHLVPLDRPHAAFTLISAFLGGRPLEQI